MIKPRHQTNSHGQSEFARQLVRGLALVAALWCLTSSTPALAVDADPVAVAGTEASAALLKVAAAEYAAGQFEKAAAHFLTCFDVDAKNLSCLFNAARAEQRSFQLDKAEKHYLLYLDLNKADAAGRKRAQIHLDEVREVRAQLKKQAAANATPPGPERKPPEVVAVPRPPEAKPAEVKVTPPTIGQDAPTPAGSWKRTAGWASVGVGAALVVTGVALVVQGSGQQTKLDAETDKTQSGFISGIGYDDYVKRQESINGRMRLGTALLGIGVAAAGAGGWLVATAPAVPQVSAVWRRDGTELVLAWRF